MRHIRALWRLIRLLAHVVRGLWTVTVRFPGWTVRERQQAVQRWAARVLALAGIGLHVDGAPRAKGPVLLVSNHISWLDIVVMHAAGYCRFVSKADVQRWPVVGRLAAAAGTLFIERSSRRDTLRVAHHMRDRLVAGDVVAIFPEGTTGDGRDLLPFHGNLLQPAISANVSIQPLALRFAHGVHGETSFAPSFVGEETLLGSVWRTLGATTLMAHVYYGMPETPGGRDRRSWAQDLQDTVARLRQLTY